LLSLCWRDIADRFQQPPMVEPVDPGQGGVLDGIQVAPGASGTDDLGLEQSDD
jgi:hypothetical protein